MTAASVELQSWGRRRWWGVVALVFIVQLALIFWLGSRIPILPRPTKALTLTLGSAAPTALQAFNDPTLFILPHPEGFSGPVWGRTYRPEFNLFEWSAPDNPLALGIERPGPVLSPLFQTSEFPPLQLPARLEAAPSLRDIPLLRLLPDQSDLRLEGGLTQRRLVASIALKSWPNQDILAPSIIGVGVDAGGRTVSATVLSRSGLPAADQYALDNAWAAQFEPLGSPGETLPKPNTQVSWGRMIFRWHTAPVQPAGTSSASP